jgi:sortase A
MSTADTPTTPSAPAPATTPSRHGSRPSGPALLVRRGLRPAVAGLALLAALAGTAVVAFSPATDAYQRRLQTRLATQLVAESTRQAYTARTVGEGQSLTRLRIPTIRADVVVVEGTSASALRAGAGHYPGTPLPGEAGTVAVAGHRTTYGKPFADLDRLSPGDEILFDTPVGSYRYRVTGAPFVVDKADWSPVAPTPGATLTLSTCHPKRSDRQRLIVKAELIPESR